MSSNGFDWQSIANGVDPSSSIEGGAQTSTGMMLYGQGASGLPTVWTSEDGHSWHESVVDPEGGWYIVSAGASPELTVVAGAADRSRLLREALVERLGPIGARFRMDNYRVTRVTVHGPLGIPLAAYAVEDLGFDPSQFSDVLDRTVVRAQTAGGEWVEGSFVNESIPERLLDRGDDGLWTVAYEGFGPRLFHTTDGVTWIDEGPTRGYMISPWRDQLLVMTDQLEIGTSPDNRNWSMRSIRQHLPDSSDWFPLMGAGDGGVAIVAQSFNFPSVPEETDHQGTDVEITHDGRTIRVSDSALTIFDADGAVVASASLWADTIDPNVSFDPERGEVTFTSLAEGKPILTLSLEELTEIEDLIARERPHSGLPHRWVLLTSPDACSWTVQELEIGERRVAWISILGDRIALGVVGSIPDPVRAGDRLVPGHNDHPGSSTELWWADMPQEIDEECAAD